MFFIYKNNFVNKYFQLLNIFILFVGAFYCSALNSEKSPNKVNVRMCNKANDLAGPSQISVVNNHFFD